jgi:hypothetical protein
LKSKHVGPGRLPEDVFGPIGSPHSVEQDGEKVPCMAIASGDGVPEDLLGLRAAGGPVEKDGKVMGRLLTPRRGGVPQQLLDFVGALIAPEQHGQQGQPLRVAGRGYPRQDFVCLRMMTSAVQLIPQRPRHAHVAGIKGRCPQMTRVPESAAVGR